MPKVAIIDCGVGNLYSIGCAMRKAGLDASIVSTPQSLKNVDALILPGVGNFKAASQILQTLKQDIASLTEEGVPLFGVCLGMQLLFEKSEEGGCEGLGLLRGSVLRLPWQVKTPHMGWNTLRVRKPHTLVEGIDESDYFYFVHSYYASPVDRDITVAETDYGLGFASVVAKGNIYGTQFHPEKSGEAGETVLRNFAMILKR